MLTTNRNLLIVADVLVVHRGFAEQKPKIVEGLVARPARRQPDGARQPGRSTSTSIGRAFKWSRDKTKTELARVHLSNLPENLAFFSGAIDEAGSFGGIYQSAVLAYGSDLIKDPLDAEQFVDLNVSLQALEKSGAFKDQKVAIAPIRTGGDARRSRPIRCSARTSASCSSRTRPTLDMSNQDNLKNLEAIKKLLQVSPGSTLLLRGHVDNAHGRGVPQAGRRGLRAHAGAASDGAEQEPRRRDPPAAHREATASTPKRIDIVGRGWEEPAGDGLGRRTGASKCSGSRLSD